MVEGFHSAKWQADNSEAVSQTSKPKVVSAESDHPNRRKGIGSPSVIFWASDLVDSIREDGQKLESVSGCDCDCNLVKKKIEWVFDPLH